MARVKRGVVAHKRHVKLLSQTRGYKLGRKNLYRQAHQAWLKAGQFAYRDRRNKKRDFRRLWIVQLNAAVRSHGMTYGQFIYGLGRAGLDLDRKVLAAMSIENQAQFADVISRVRASFSQTSASVPKAKTIAKKSGVKT